MSINHLKNLGRYADQLESVADDIEKLEQERDELTTALRKCVVALQVVDYQCLDKEDECPCSRCIALTDAKGLLKRYK